MGAKKKIAKLKKKLRKMHTCLVLTRSDLNIKLDSETYRANLAETKVDSLTYELDTIKFKLAVLQRATTEKPDGTNTAAEIKDTPIPIIEVFEGTASDNGSAPVAAQVS